MHSGYSMYQFAGADTTHLEDLQSNDCELIVRQQPRAARVSLSEREKNRKPIDPPPILQLKVSHEADPLESYLQSPFLFASCNLVAAPGSPPAETTLGTSLVGTLVSSLHRLKDSENIDGAFFIFGDVSAKLEGRFALRFNLYEMRGTECVHLQSVLSEPFVVYGAKHFPGMSESTLLTRTFSDQGIRLRLRKEPRSLLRKGGPASDDYVPRSYNRQRNQGAKPELQSRDGDESPESSRHSHSEEGGYVHSQQMLPSPFEQHPQVGHTYSQQSIESFASYEEPMMKRQRTGSEHSQRQSFGQSAYNQFAQQSPQQPAYGYFAAHLNTPQETTPPFHPGSRNSSAPGDFASQLQTPYQQFPYGGQMMPTSSPRSGGPDSFGSMGIADRMQSSPGMGGMAPPHDFRFGRMSTSPGLGLLSSDQGYRRGGVGMYGSQNPNISLSMRSDLFEEGPSAAMTTTAPAPAPGMMEGL